MYRNNDPNLSMHSLVYYAEIQWVNKDDRLLGLTLKFPCLTCLYKCFLTLYLERIIFILSLLNVPGP